MHINDQTVNDEALIPFGGVGESGTGSRHGGTQANLDAFTETQWVTVRGDLPAYPLTCAARRHEGRTAHGVSGARRNAPARQSRLLPDAAANRSIEASALTTSSLRTSNGIAWIVSPAHGRRIGDCPQRLVVVGAEPDLGQRGRQPDPGGELDEVADVARSAPLQDELGDRADVHLLPVREPVRRPDGGEPVVDGMRGGQPAGFEPEAGQQRVRLDDLLHGRRDQVVLTASMACSAFSHSTSQLSSASAVPVSVGSPPAIVFELDRWSPAPRARSPARRRRPR